MRLPEEHPVATIREIAKIAIPALALMAASVAGYIAFQQLNLVRLSSERQLRAYVMLSSARIRDIGVNLKPRMEITVRNYGQTPALDVEVRGTFQIDAPGRGPLGPYETEPPSRGAMAPTEEVFINVDASRNLTEAEHDKFQKGELVIYLDLDISYNDVFGIARSSRFSRIADNTFDPGIKMMRSNHGDKFN
ncbi:MAG: hypothetical protein JWR80_28 [Bradyrhizobium sp.]|nr:hypothetical protein [Bradyrhizobium sp.]